MGVHAEPLLICTLPGACGLSSLLDEAQTLPSGWAHPLVAGHTPPVGACSLSSLQHEVRTVPGLCAQSPRRVAEWRGDWSCCYRGISQSAPKGIFVLGKILLLNPVAPSMQGRACPLAQPTSPARLTLSGSGPTWPNSQLSPASVPLSVGLPLHPYSLP